jgi:hypothetical protein
MSLFNRYNKSQKFRMQHRSDVESAREATQEASRGIPKICTTGSQTIPHRTIRIYLQPRSRWGIPRHRNKTRSPSRMLHNMQPVKHAVRRPPESKVRQKGFQETVQTFLVSTSPLQIKLWIQVSIFFNRSAGHKYMQKEYTNIPWITELTSYNRNSSPFKVANLTEISCPRFTLKYGTP